MKKKSRNLDKIAKFVSEIAVPPFFTITLFCFFSYYFISSHKEATFIAFIAVFFTTISPAVFVVGLLLTGKITHHHVPDKNQRTAPYLFSAISFAVGFWVLHRVSAPTIIQALILSSLVNLILMLIINTRWKISSHTLSAAAGVAGLQVVFGWVIGIFYIVIILVGWARVRIKAHTLSEVISGAIVGFVLTFIQMIYYLNVLQN